MNFLILLALVQAAFCGLVDEEHGVEHHERATSYQNIHIEHFHPVPTYIRKEHSELLEHPVSLGTSSSKVEVHHGGKHDHGYAFANAENNVHGHALGDDGLTGGHEALAGYQVQDQEEFSQYEGHLGQAEAGLGHYQLGSGVQGYGGHQYDGHDS